MSQLSAVVQNYWAVFIGLALIVLYAYWPTFVWAEDAWRNEPDYSHGYLILPLAAMLCWVRADSFPGIRSMPSWSGVWLIVLAIVMRFSSRLIYADFLDGWSLFPLLAGCVWILFGFKAMRWSLPSLAFLLLMIPMPYQAESLLSWKLQGVATSLSTTFLRVLGQPAVSEGHVIWVNDQRLLIEQACSGLRIFMGIGALAFFWAATVNRQRGWIDRIILISLIIPLAVFVNAVRITCVGLLYQSFTDPATQTSIHDWSGYLMIPFAFGLLWLAKTYWQNLYQPVEPMTAKDVLNASHELQHFASGSTS
ncbi:exosortase/archaeosortase family protein [Rubripirellula amarantea]|uniref:exosortase/archaeosortase family protein n=1 Tax=Rubripirellula amarantea TaxID=2527999 RepID=UPI001F5EEBEE|nr:exosortase/archaeosortase family protein [Rubripirellula amarantea]